MEVEGVLGPVLVQRAVCVQRFRPRAEQRCNGGTTCRGACATSAVLHSGAAEHVHLAERGIPAMWGKHTKSPTLREREGGGRGASTFARASDQI